MEAQCRCLGCSSLNRRTVARRTLVGVEQSIQGRRGVGWDFGLLSPESPLPRLSPMSLLSPMSPMSLLSPMSPMSLLFLP
jgi:hypothetical protein